MKTIKRNQFVSIKRVAQNVNPLIIKRDKLSAKIEQLNEEIQSVNSQIDCFEAGIKALTGGYTSEDLITTEVIITTALDDRGQNIKKTEYRPSELVYWDEENKVYVIKEIPKQVAQSIEEINDNYNFD